MIHPTLTAHPPPLQPPRISAPVAKAATTSAAAAGPLPLPPKACLAPVGALPLGFLKALPIKSAPAAIGPTPAAIGPTPATLRLTQL